MAWDIYENELPKGHCEIHPEVDQEYPCYLYLQQMEYEKNKIIEIEEYYKSQKEYYEQLAREKGILFRILYNLEFILKKIIQNIQVYKRSMLYRVLYYLEFILNRLTQKIQNCKQRILNKLVF